MKTLLIVAAVGLAGCASDGQMCENFGFTPGTDGFANCMQNRDAQRQAMIQQQQVRQQAQQQAWYDQQMQSIRSAQQANSARQNQTTNCRWIGSTWNCNSY